MHQEKSEQLYQEALEVIIGGVNSPSRSYKAVGGGTPLFMKRAKGGYIWDVDGNRYIDYLAAYGPLILGHGHPSLVKAICVAAENGTLYGTSTPYEVELAKGIREAIPSMERIRFVNSGTEAVMTTIRVARAYTGRTMILKFEGCYHGHSDPVLVAAGSGPATLGVPDSAGIPESISKEVITVPFNDPDALNLAMEKWGDKIAAILVEPIVGNFGIVAPAEGFLQHVDKTAEEYGALVIYDEVITGFRFHYGGAQNLYGISPDLTALGKVIGGGLPIGAYGGKREIMEQVSPLGPAYQAGTMAGNPASMLAGIATLRELRQEGFYEHLDELAKALTEGLLRLSQKHGIPLTINRVKGAFSTHFTDQAVRNYTDAKNADSKQYALFFKEMLRRGILLAPSKFEAWFIQSPHTMEDIQLTLQAADESLAALASL